MKLAEAGWAFPIVGLVVGLIAAAVGQVLLGFGAPSVIVAGAVLLIMVLVTGALHEDGLADVADGLGGGHSVERKLEIMRDSSTGAYGVIALVFSLLLRFSLLNLLITSGLVSLWLVLPLALMTSRAFMLVAMSSPGTHQQGGKSLGASAGVASSLVAILWICALAGVFSLISFIGFVFVAIVGLGARWYFLRHIGGMTGDGYGFIEQVTQIATLVVFAWVFS